MRIVNRATRDRNWISRTILAIILISAVLAGASTRAHATATKTVTTLTSSPNPSTDGQKVVIIATVSSALGAPPNGGIVTFKKGRTVLGTKKIFGGLASIGISTLKVGTTGIKAVYGGDSNFARSTSKPIKQVVEKSGQ